MISLFRKIRHSLLAQNRVIRYLAYAVGEIVLVTIGILIALQVNTWNSNRLENKQEQITLKALKEDFLQSKKNLDSTVFSQTRVVNYCTRLLKVLLEEDQTADPDSLGIYVYRGAFSYWRFEATNGTYDALISSGNTGLIKNEDLNRLLAEYTAQLKYGFEDETESIDLTTVLIEISAVYAPTLGDKMLKQFALVNSEKIFSQQEIGLSKEQLLQDRVFRGVLANKAILEKNRIEYYQSISAILNEILKLIDQDLDHLD